MIAGQPIQPNLPEQPNPAALLEPHKSLISQLYARSGGSDYSLSSLEFTAILAEIVARQLPAEASSDAVRDLLESLRVDELVLARACAAGTERAWDVFLTRYREGLYSAALSIAHNDAVAHDLADSLYADLFGTEAPQGRRISKLASYYGIGSLQGWLRTILAHGFIDRYRTERPVVSLTSQKEDDDEFDVPAPPLTIEKSVDPRLESATDEALQSLDPEDRYLLASYFLHNRTLAEIGRILDLHESSVKRRIDKLTGKLRKKITSGLTRKGMSRAQVEEALDIDIRDLQINVRSRIEEITQDSPADPSLVQESNDAITTQSKMRGEGNRDKE